MSLYCGEALGQVIVDFSFEDGGHDKFGVVDADLGLKDVGHDVQVVLAGDDQVGWILSGTIEFLDLFDTFSPSIFDNTTGVFDDRFQLFPRRIQAGCQIENAALK